MKIILEVMEDGMVTVSMDGGEPMGPMQAEEALSEVEMAMGGGEEDMQAMWDEEAGMDDSEMMEDM